MRLPDLRPTVLLALLIPLAAPSYADKCQTTKGCLDASGMELLRRGLAPTITTGPYAGQKLTVDHITPRAVAPQLDTLLANLEFMPAHMNFSKGAKIGQRQIDLAAKFLQAGLISEHDHALISRRQETQ
jgi:hypothetical protein